MIDNELLKAARATLDLWEKHGLGDDEVESEPVYARLKRAVERAESAVRSSTERTMREAKFNIDFLEGQVFEGYTRGEDWNGFACPYFTFEQAHRLLEAWRSSGRSARYNGEADQFDFEVDASGERERDQFPAVNVDGVKMYPIGNGCRIWEEVVQEGAGL